MAKNNFLLVDLNESQTKKLAETITSDTSRRILNYLAERDEAEANLAKELNLPISTVHYHLQKLMEAKLVLVKEFHYSPKGREVNHYKLANKYIIIAPKKVSGLKEKLKGILPVAGVALGISAVMKIITMLDQRQMTSTAGKLLTEEMAYETTQALPEALDASSAVPTAMEQSAETLSAAAGGTGPDIALWFLMGSVATIVIYIIIEFIKSRIKK